MIGFPPPKKHTHTYIHIYIYIYIGPFRCIDGLIRVQDSGLRTLYELCPGSFGEDTRFRFP